jgi:hypothetical protein
MSGVLLDTLGEKAGDLSHRSSEFINAVDFLLTGF